MSVPDARPRSVTEAAAVLDEFVTPGLGATIDRLRRWTGEFPASTPGAPPPPPSDPLTPEQAARRELEGKLTKVEQDAIAPDFARRELMLTAELLGRLRHSAEQLGLPSRPTRPAVPELATVAEVAAELAAVAWLTQPDRMAELSIEDRHRVIIDVETLARIVANTVPVATGAVVMNCHSHQKAGDPYQPIDERYKGLHLCRWCGEFRATHGQYPPPSIVRLHDRGIRPNRDQLRRAGVR